MTLCPSLHCQLCWGWQFLSTWFVCLFVRSFVFLEFQHFLSKYCFDETSYVCAGQPVTSRNEEQGFLALTSTGGRSIVSMVVLIFLHHPRALVGTGGPGMLHKGRLYFQRSSHRWSQWRPGAAFVIRWVLHDDISEECRPGLCICRMLPWSWLPDMSSQLESGHAFEMGIP